MGPYENNKKIFLLLLSYALSLFFLCVRRRPLVDEKNQYFLMPSTKLQLLHFLGVVGIFSIPTYPKYFITQQK